ncbi:DUF177 domain-containing protein [Phenylobacterium sp.]|uniref:YceD family protein n=1 Tax=Phenylobacterium sp. TaxID=1871053 RepID=UPI002C95F25F|nr:DUF177 domain-containing protein [Phenylobacterium sp.]HVI32941.1 DUF177 domain-containing protein [Phenylobacterium sp.]
MSADWTKPLRLHELGRGSVTLTLEPDAAERAKVAHDLGLESLPALTAQVTVKPWLDGAEITGRFRAVVEQICSVSLDPFEQTLEGVIEVRAVPQGSPHAPAAEGGEMELDPDAPDPPDVLEGEAVDVAGYVVEHLALEVDPFPRKPGVEFDYTPPTQEESPFAVLKKLKDPEG